ncbi:MAG: IS21-like element helper ATPase IstB [Armatimonadota bacterium]
MLLEQTLDKLYQLKLGAMAAVVREQQMNPAMAELTFEERLGLLVDREWDARENRGLTRRLQVARLKVPACVEDLDFRADRGLDKSVLLRLAECRFIPEHHHVLITGPTGVGKTYLACALGQAACRLQYRVRYQRCDQLLTALQLARLDGSYPAFLRRVEKTDLLILDDWGVTPFDQAAARDLFDLIDDRTTRGALVITSQAPLDTWYDLIAAPQLADAILDRVVHHAYKIPLHGESMRKRQAAALLPTCAAGEDRPIDQS